MKVSCGILGLPNSGKTTLFNTMTKSLAGVADAYPFTTIAPNRGRVLVPDERLQQIAAIMRPQSRECADFPIVDIAGLVKGASQGEGLGNQFLAHVREMAMLIHVVRCFTSSDVAHVEGSLSPERDIAIIDLELCMADLETIKRRRERLAQEGKSKAQSMRGIEGQQLDRLEQWLDQGLPLRTQALSPDDSALAKTLALVSAKPVLFVGNVDEADMADPAANPHYSHLLKVAEQQQCSVVPLCAQLASELAILSEEEQEMFMEELGFNQGDIGDLSRAVYQTLSLLTFFTVNEKEVRARALIAGETALTAAGDVHTDMARGFIRAEVITVPQLVEAGAMGAARDRGWVRLEGKDYVVQDGDILHIRFAV